MALFKSSLLASASGSVGGTVYSRNRAGAYTRNRTAPSFPNSPTQEYMRSINITLGGYWDGVSQQNQGRWTDWASTHPVVNRVGDDRRWTGREAFLHVNFYRVLAGESVLDLPPDLGSRGDLTTVIAPVGNFVDADAEEQEIFFTNQAKLVGYVFAFISDVVNSGSFSVKRPLRYFGSAFFDDVAEVRVVGNFAYRRTISHPSRFVCRLVTQDNFGYVSSDWIGIVGTSN